MCFMSVMFSAFFFPKKKCKKGTFHKKQLPTVITGENRSLRNLWPILKDWVPNVAMNHCTACPKLFISRKLLLFMVKKFGCCFF